MNMQWYDVVGAIGVVLIIVTYAAVQMRKMEATNITYSSTNLIGAVMILISLLYNFNLASFVIEIFWILISLWGIVEWLKSRNTQTDEIE